MFNPLTEVKDLPYYNESPPIMGYLPVRENKVKKIIAPTMAQLRRQDSSELDMFDEAPAIQLPSSKVSGSVLDSQRGSRIGSGSRDRTKSGFSDTKSDQSHLSVTVSKAD